MFKKEKTVSKILRTKLTSTMTFAVTAETVSAKIKEYHQFKTLYAIKQHHKLQLLILYQTTETTLEDGFIKDGKTVYMSSIFTSILPCKTSEFMMGRET